jgi:hypothetical protein
MSVAYRGDPAGDSGHRRTRERLSIVETTRSSGCHDDRFISHASLKVASTNFRRTVTVLVSPVSRHRTCARAVVADVVALPEGADQAPTPTS